MDRDVQLRYRLELRMTRRFVVGMVLAAALCLPGFVLAHEGHPHKVMGVVEARHDNHLEVKATNGKSSAITLNEKTKILRGKTPVAIDEVKPGERVVVTALQTKGQDGKVMMVATEVRLGAPPKTR
jgi:hypothetical protein